VECYAGSGPARIWNLIAVEVSDFSSIDGLQPAMAGLANLSRRKWVILAAAGELRDPEVVLAALKHFTAHPAQRAELATPTGARALSRPPPTAHLGT